MLHFLLQQFSTNSSADTYSFGLQFPKSLLVLAVRCWQLLLSKLVRQYLL